MSHGTPGKVVQVLAIDPSNTSTLYAGRNRRGMDQTTDSGASWRTRKVGESGRAARKTRAPPATA